jgi:hypothetical protein
MVERAVNAIGVARGTNYLRSIGNETLAHEHARALGALVGPERQALPLFVHRRDYRALRGASEPELVRAIESRSAPFSRSNQLFDSPFYDHKSP